MQIWESETGIPFVDETGALIECPTCACPEGMCSCITLPADRDCVGTGGESIALCLLDMLAVVDLVFEDTSECSFSAMNGSYVMSGPGPVWGISDEIVTRALNRTGCGGINTHVGSSPNNVAMTLSIACVDDELEISVGAGPNTTDDDFVAWRAFGSFSTSPTPIEVSNGAEFNLIPDNDSGWIHTTHGFTEDTWPSTHLVSCKVRFFGVPCEGLDLNCPLVCLGASGISYSNTEEVFGIHPCVSPIPITYTKYNGCNYHVSIQDIVNACNIIGCYWNDGVESCEDRDFDLSDECGSYSTSDGITVVLIDEGGCGLIFSTGPLSCCNCCDLDVDDAVDEDDPVTFDDCFDTFCPDLFGDPAAFHIPPNACICGSTNSCGQYPHNPIFKKITLPAIGLTDCDPIEDIIEEDRDGCWHLDWSGVIGERDGGTLPSIGLPGQEIRYWIDMGFEGGSACIELQAFDPLGCFSAKQYIYYQNPYTVEIPPGCEESPPPDVDCP